MINEYELLTYIKLSQSGNRQARSELLQSYQLPLCDLAGKYVKLGYSMRDCMAEACIGFDEGVSSYSDSTGVSFNDYAMNSAKTRIEDFIDKNLPDIPMTVPKEFIRNHKCTEIKFIPNVNNKRGSLPYIETVVRKDESFEEITDKIVFPNLSGLTRFEVKLLQRFFLEDLWSQNTYKNYPNYMINLRKKVRSALNRVRNLNKGTIK